jgi:hypothetical protein
MVPANFSRPSPMSKLDRPARRGGGVSAQRFVMPGLVPGIHVFTV